MLCAAPSDIAVADGELRANDRDLLCALTRLSLALIVRICSIKVDMLGAMIRIGIPLF